VKTITLSLGLLLTACAHGPHYTVTLDVYLRDADALCRQAWAAALPDHGPAITEMLTMQNGKFDPQRCLATVYQKMRLEGAESRGIYVQESQK
jgi:hypothetical protein